MRRPNFWNYNLLLKCNSQLQRNGYLYIKNLTPNFQWIGFSQILTQTCLLPQVQTVSKRDLKKTSLNAIYWHTDGSYNLIPPRYLAVWCLEPERNGENIFRLADGKALLHQGFSELEQRQLMKKQYGFISTDGTRKIFAPILYCPSRTKDIIRYSENIIPETIASDNWSEKVSDRISRFCNQNHLKFSLEKYNLLIIDNHRMLHSRSLFSYSQRYLQRIWLGY